MRNLVLGSFALTLIGCTSTPPPREVVVASRAPSSVRVLSDEEWYASHAPETHYVRAIANDDLPRMEKWIELGLSAEYRVTPVHPSVIQAALAAHRRDIVRLLIENPHVHLRPNPHRPIALCPAKEDHLVVNLYEYIVFDGANERFERTCRDDDYFSERERAEANLVITPFMLEMFLSVAGNATSKAEFRADTRLITRALKASPLTRDSESANARLLEFIENY